MVELSTLAEKLIKLSPSVRVVSICDLNGKLVFSAHSKRVRVTLSAKESKDSLRIAAKAWKLRKSLSRKLGRCRYVVAEYDSVKRITMPAGKSHILYVTTSSGMDHNKVIRKVRSFR